MNQQHDRDALEEHVRGLAREVAPERDLWPGIASRLNQRDLERKEARQRWSVGNWFSVGVAVAAGYLLASWFPLPWAPGQTESLQPRIELLASVQPALERLPAKTRAVVEVDLSGLDRDRLGIELALAMDPENPLLRELWMSVENRASSVSEQMNRLTNSVSERIEI